MKTDPTTMNNVVAVAPV